MNDGRMFEKVYRELKVIARRYMSRERSDHTLQPTAIVHEAYLKMVRSGQSNPKDRTHFVAVAALVMRQVLVDHARRYRAGKRQKHEGHLTVSLGSPGNHECNWDILALHEALDRLVDQSPNGERHARLIQLTYFGGLTREEAACELGVSRRTAERDWQWARTWLAKELSDESCSMDQ